MVRFERVQDVDWVELRPVSEAGILGRWLGRTDSPKLNELPEEEHALAFALADISGLAEEHGLEVEIQPDVIRLPHDIVARVGSDVAAVLGLPPVVHLTLETEVEGLLGQPNFCLRCRWTSGGRPVSPRRTGSILETSDGPRRIPISMLKAIEIAETLGEDSSLAEHWNALARFRQSLDPEEGAAPDHPDFAAKARMTEFLATLRIGAADAMSISPRESSIGTDFDPVPFSRRHLGQTDEPAEGDAELQGEELGNFQRAFRAYGARPAYPTGDNSYLVIDPGAMPIVEVMAEMQRAPKAEREGFIRNPRERITEAYRRKLQQDGTLDGLDAANAEAEVESAAFPCLVETREYSERVIGVGRWSPPELPIEAPPATTWLPEVFQESVREALASLTAERLRQVAKEARDAASKGEDEIQLNGVAIPTDAETVRAIEALATRRENESGDREDAAPVSDTDHGDRIVVTTHDNFFTVNWNPAETARSTEAAAQPVPEIATELLFHQRTSLDWSVAAWKAGFPGILNADEPGLGKTLQTIAFLAWMQARIRDGEARSTGPVLVVAPTSLLENWEAEVERHMHPPRLGGLIRLYGPDLSRRRRAGSGREMRDGQPTLDLDLLQEKVAEGRGYEHWLLTTYTTMTNYQHSLARLSFSAIVFDEIQALKNPATLAANAARALHGDFRIGLTGTPVENRIVDLWAIMDQLTPGAFGSLASFARTFASLDPVAMNSLHENLFSADGTRPAFAQRRLKSEVARDLPPKHRLLHPRQMPEAQAIAYEAAREKLTPGARGGALSALHHIRSVSAHPGGDVQDDEDFIAASARLAGVVQILDVLRDRGERALLFIEDRRLQHRVAALLKRRYALPDVSIINGATPVRRRLAIVNHFQRHLERDGGFDVLILGPRAAGVGLTLTAATHVIHLSRWWNPAVEEQCNDRVHRIGQKRQVTIHTPLALHPAWTTGSFDCLLHDLMHRKRRLAWQVLSPTDTEDDVQALMQGLLGSKAPAGSAFDGSAEDLREMLTSMAGHWQLTEPAAGVFVLTDAEDENEFSLGFIAAGVKETEAAGRLLAPCNAVYVFAPFRADSAPTIVNYLNGKAKNAFPKYVLDV